MPSTGPCEPWTSIDEVRACGCPEPPDGPSDLAILAAIDFASEVLYGLTNRLFSGVCVDVVRPCARTAGGGPAVGPYGLPAGWSSGGWSQWWRWDKTWGYCSCNRGRECGCSILSEIALPGYPIQEILEVLVDGVALVEGVNFRVDDDRFLVRIDGESWPCFPAGTQVLTSEGHKPIEKIEAGEMVLTHENRWRRVTRAGQTGVSETVEVAGRGGTVRCTSDHRFWSSEMHGRPGHFKLGSPEWTEASQLAGHAWATPRSVETLPMRLPQGWTEADLPDDFWWFVGRWIGDGSTEAANGRVSVCCGHHEADALQERLDGMGWDWKRSGGRTASKLRVSRPGLAEWLRAEFGSNARDKEIPAWVLGASEKLRRAVLDGYVSADGYVFSTKPSRAFTTSVRTVSERLARSCHILAATLGFAPMLYEGIQRSNTIEGRKVSVAERTFRVDWTDTPPGGRMSQAWADDAHLWGRVRSITLDETEVPVYDLEVEDDHSFTANGFVVHNCCQNLAAEPTEVDTWQVRYEFGVAPSLGASRAAADYACQIARRCAGMPCQLPERISSISRQGVTAAFLDPQDYIAAGLTGLPLVDTWISSITLGKRRRGPARIASVDVGRRVRRTRDADGS